MLKFWARRKQVYRDGTMSNKSILRVLLNGNGNQFYSENLKIFGAMFIDFRKIKYEKEF